MKRIIAVILVACFAMNLFAGEISLKYNSKNAMSTKWTPMLDGEKISREYFYDLVGREDLSVAEVKKNAKMKAAIALSAGGLVLSSIGLVEQMIVPNSNTEFEMITGLALCFVGLSLGYKYESESAYSVSFATSLIDTHKLAVGATISK